MLVAVVACATPAYSDNEPPARTCGKLALRQWQTAAASPLAGSNITIQSNGQQFLAVDESPPHDAALYDPCTDRWTKLLAKDAEAWLRRNRVAIPYDDAVRVGDKRVLIPSSRTTSMAQFDAAKIVDVASGKERKVAPAAAPAERNANGSIPGNHLELPIGDAVFVWGGSGLAGYATDGGILDLKTARWRKISTRGAPSSRDAPNAVWTGREVIVWGGLGDPIRTAPNAAPTGRIGFTDGARYDPKTDRWTKLDARSAPSARNEPVIGWTGHSFLVSGGSAVDDSSVFTVGSANVSSTAGGLYDPRTDRWRSLPPPAGFTTVSRGTLAGPKGVALVGSGGIAVLDEPKAGWTILPGNGVFGGAFGWSGSILLVYRGFDPGPPGPNGCEGATRPCDPVSRTTWITDIHVIRLF